MKQSKGMYRSKIEMSLPKKVSKLRDRTVRMYRDRTVRMYNTYGSPNPVMEYTHVEACSLYQVRREHVPENIEQPS